MTDSLEEIAARAAHHQDVIDRDTKFFSIAMLAARWGCAKGTVRAIPFDELPWTNMGRGLVRELRRYHPDDVAAFENADHGVPGRRQGGRQGERQSERQGERQANPHQKSA